MVNIEEIMTPERFEDWVNSMPESALVTTGVAPISEHCPIASFIKAHKIPHAQVTPTHVRYRNNDCDWKTFMLPEFFTLYVTLHDDFYWRQEATAAQVKFVISAVKRAYLKSTSL